MTLCVSPCLQLLQQLMLPRTSSSPLSPQPPSHSLGAPRPHASQDTMLHMRSLEADPVSSPLAHMLARTMPPSLVRYATVEAYHKFNISIGV